MIGVVLVMSMVRSRQLMELIVPHCDPTVNMFDFFYVIEACQVVDVWPIDLRGKSQ